MSLCLHSPCVTVGNAPFILQAVVPQLEVFLGSRTAPQVAPFCPRWIHYWQVVTDWTRFSTINKSRMTILKTSVTKKQPPLTLTHLQRNDQCLNLPYVTALHQKTTESQPYVHRGPHLRSP